MVPGSHGGGLLTHRLDDDGRSHVVLSADAGETFELLLGPVFPDWAPDDVQ